MSFKTPKVKDVVKETPPPLINMAETGADVQNQRSKRGLLSTFLQGSRNMTSGFFANAVNQQKTTTTGNAPI